MLDNSNTQVDYAAVQFARLMKDYESLVVTSMKIRTDLSKLPKVINDITTLELYGKPITEANDLIKRLVAYHDAEKSPFLNGGRGVDNFFFGEISKLGRRKDGDPAGAVNIAQARVDDFAQRLLEAEQAKRAAEAREAIEKQRKLDEQAALERQAAIDAEAAASRARKPENIEAHLDAASEFAEAAAKTEFLAERAAEAADDALIDTLAKPADMVRTRLSGGGMLSMGTTPEVRIVNVKLLDKEELWPFLKEEHILQALKNYAKTKDYKVEMAGAYVGKRNKGRIQG